MSKNKKILISVIILTVISIAILAGLFVWNQQEQKEKKIETFFAANDKLVDLSTQVEQSGSFLTAQALPDTLTETGTEIPNKVGPFAPFEDKLNPDADIDQLIDLFKQTITNLESVEAPPEIENEINQLISDMKTLVSLYDGNEERLDYLTKMIGAFSHPAIDEDIDFRSIGFMDKLIAGYDIVIAEYQALTPPAGAEEYHQLVIQDLQTYQKYHKDGAAAQDVLNQAFAQNPSLLDEFLALDLTTDLDVYQDFYQRAVNTIDPNYQYPRLEISDFKSSSFDTTSIIFGMKLDDVIALTEGIGEKIQIIETYRLENGF